MGLIKCPNCGKKVFDDYQCGYCKFVLNPKENHFDRDIYQFLYDDYLVSKNKAITIKNGTSKFHKPMEEIKEIVDFIANKVYEESQYKSKEELEATSEYVVEHHKNVKVISMILMVVSVLLLGIFIKGNNKPLMLVSIFLFILSLISFIVGLSTQKAYFKNTYYFSFLEYFIHDLCYKIILLIAIFLFPLWKIDMFRNKEMIILICYGISFFFISYIIYKWIVTSTSEFVIAPGKVVYKYNRPNLTATKEEIEINKYPERAWQNEISYDISKIDQVKETINSFIIYGNITKNQEWNEHGSMRSSKPKTIRKIRIKKCFKNNSELIHKLRNKNISY